MSSANHKHAQALHHMMTTQDSDSGLSMPSGTLRSAYTMTTAGTPTPRLAEEEHEKLIQSLLLRRSMESLPISASAFTSPTIHRPHTATPTRMMSSTLGESYLYPQRASSPDMFTRSRTPLHHQSHQNLLSSSLRETPDSLAGDNMRRSTDRLSAIAPEMYFTAGLKNALNDSQTRRNALLDKLREAQDTLRLQSARLSKMETDYHSNSYQVEELKSNEAKLIKQITDLEKQKQDLNDLRLRDLDTQITLQDRIKEFENGMQNMAADFQLLETDHARRRELVEQLSTTVELVEEENRKLHKVEQSIGTEVQCLRREIITAKEEKDSLNNQLDSQRREAKHWKEEVEQLQNQLRQSQESVSELKIKSTSLTHKLENLESKERQLLQENDALRSKDRELHDKMTDMRSKVAILSADKERLYQEKSDLGERMEKQNLTNKQLQEEVQGLQLTMRKHIHELQTRDSDITQLTETNQQLTDELSGSQKVGEKLSLELTRTKELLDRHEEEAETLKQRSRDNLQTINDLQNQSRDSRQQLTKLQSESDYLRDDFTREKMDLQHKLDSLQNKLRDQAKEHTTLIDSHNTLQQKLSQSERNAAQQISELQSEVNTWRDKNESNQGSLQRKEDEISMLSQKVAECDAQINTLLMEQSAKAIDYENYKELQEETQRLSLTNRRLQQEHTESEQMVQLLQTQRAIYARSVQEYSTKVLDAEKSIEENKQLQQTIDILRNTQKTLEDDIANLNDLKRTLDNEIANLRANMTAIKSENTEVKQERDKLEQENVLLKNAVQENFELKQKLHQVEGELGTSKAKIEELDKSVISHLSNQNTALNTKIGELSSQLAEYSNTSQDTDRELSLLSNSKLKLEQEAKNLQQQIDYLQSQYEESRNEVKENREAVRKLEQEKTNLNLDLNKAQTQIDVLEKKNSDLEDRLVKASAMTEHCRKQQERIEELTNQTTMSAADNEAMTGRLTKLEVELDLSNKSLDDKTNLTRELTSDLNITHREKQHLQNELERLERRLSDMRGSSDSQLSGLTDKLEKAEDTRLTVQQRLNEAESDLYDCKNKLRRASAELSEKTELADSLSLTLESLRKELKGSADLQTRQEELITTLKEETGILSEMEMEMKDVKRKYKDLKHINDEQNELINRLKREADGKEVMERQLQEIGTDLVCVKNELQRTYSSMNQKELELERLEQQCENAKLDAENSEEKSAELKIRLEQAEQAKSVSSSTLQERIHSLEAEIHTYKTQIMQLERQLSETNGKLNSTSNRLDISDNVSALNQESLATVSLERDSLLTECQNLRTHNQKLIAQQGHLDAEKRKIQLQLKEVKIYMFKVEKEKENLERSNSRLDTSASESNRLLKTVTEEYENTRTKLTEVDRANERLRKDYNYVKDELIDLTEASEAEKDQLQSEVRQLQKQLTDLKARLRELEFEQVKSAPVPTQLESMSARNQEMTSPEDDKEKNFDHEKYVHKRREPVHTVDKPNGLNISNETLPSITASVETEASSVQDAGAQARGEGRMMAAEISTDSSGDSWPEIGSQPELSEAISSGKLGESDSALDRTLPKGMDEIDGTEAGTPFAVTELPVTIAVDAGTRGKAQLGLLKELVDEDNLLEESVEQESEEEDENGDVASSKPEPGLTRDKTLKIFKQLKKAKQRSKKCLAPIPKITKENTKDDEKDTGSKRTERLNSFEKPTNATEDQDEAVDVKHIKEDIIAKSGKVEWRGDPREAHRRYLSSWDLSVISDAEEAEHDPESGDEGGDNSQPIAIMEKVDNSPVQTEESASISSDYLQSLLNAASGQQGGSLDSLQSVGVLDSPLISRNSDSAGTGASSIEKTPLVSDNSDDNIQLREELNLQLDFQTTPSSSRSRIPVTSSPQSSPLTPRRSPRSQPTSPSRIPKFGQQQPSVSTSTDDKQNSETPSSAQGST